MTQKPALRNFFNQLKKGRMMNIVFTAVLLLLLVVLILRTVLTAYRPAALQSVEISGPPRPLLDFDSELKFLSWNVGFAGMSAEMDFIADGGRRYRASSSNQVEDNYNSILNQLQVIDAHILFLQELSRDSFLTRGKDVLGGLQQELINYRSLYTPTVRIRFLPLAGNLDIGKATWSTWDIESGIRRALPTCTDLPTITIQHFNILEARLPVQGVQWEWVLLNIHLSAFDDGDLREEQFKQVVALMEAEYRIGNRVVAGGDWNMLLADTEFPYTTDKEYLFWVRELPAGIVPQGWQWGLDSTVPTCRTLEQSYQIGVNYTCVIDGYLVSPNVEIVRTETVDLKFENSDHNPVVMVARSR